MILGTLILLTCVFGLGYKIGWDKSRAHHSPKQGNPFIRAHQSMSERDQMFEAYKDWCHKNGEYPLAAMDFHSELQNNKQLREAVDKAMNS